MRQLAFQLLSLFLCLPLLLAGCATTQVAHPQLRERLRSIKTISVMRPAVKAYEFGQNGTAWVEPMPDWEGEGRTNLANAIKEQFRIDRRFVLHELDPPLKYALALHRLRWEKTRRIWAHEALPCQQHPAPGLAEIAEAQGADAVLLTFAQDNIETEKEKAFSRRAGDTLGWFLVAPFLLLAALINPVGFHRVFFAGGNTTIQMCLVDAATGEVLWSWLDEVFGKDNLRDFSKASDIVAEAYEELLEQGELEYRHDNF